jgi:hypothetical protein
MMRSQRRKQDRQKVIVSKHVSVAEESACIQDVCVHLTSEHGTEERYVTLANHCLVMRRQCRMRSIMLGAFAAVCSCRDYLIMRNMRGGLTEASILSSLKDAKAVTLRDVPCMFAP